jgi:hypothetical protein
LFAGGIIPVTRLDPTAVNIMNEAVPLANLPNNFYEVTETRPQNTDDLTWKVDHSLGANHRLSGSYFRATGFDRETLAGTLPWSRRRMETTQHNFNASDTWTISPSMVNQLRVSYMRYITVRENTPAKTLADFGSQFRVQGTPSLPQIQVGGYFNLNQAIAGPMMGGNVYGVRQMLSITRGRHSMKMGGDFALDKMVQYTDLNNYGTFNFDGARTLNGFADYLLGRPRTMNQDAPIEKSVNGWYNSLYFQDDIRLHPRFTLNIGVRYELQLPMTDPHDRLITFIPGPAVPGRRGDLARHHADRRQQFRTACRVCVGSGWARQDLDPWRRGPVLQRAGRGHVRPGSRPAAVHSAPAVQQREVSDGTLCIAARRRIAVPVCV